MIKIAEEIDLENYTLILPSVAVGNVGQLCVDLIISSLNLDKIGSSWNPMFIPICGLDPYRDDYDDGSSSLCTTADLYVGTSRNIILFQLRSPYVGNSTSFFDELSRFIRRKKIGKTVILTSSYDYERAERPEPALRYLTTDTCLMETEKLVESLRWTKHTERQSSLTGPETMTTTTQRRYIPGGGFASALFEHLESNEIPCTVLFCYCSEGDNVSDALILFNGLNRWLNFMKDGTSNVNCIKYPPSWKYFFGNPPSVEMY